MRSNNRPWLAIISAVVAIVALSILSWLSQPPEDALVVYCSHDSIYSEVILRDFERRTGIQVVIRFDTEATKSLGLVNLLIAEKDGPQCDVFWNNEVLGTMRLKNEGVLAPYAGAGYRRIPDSFKDPESYWTGFAARLRVGIMNTATAIPLQTDPISEESDADLSDMAIAKPLYGTSLTHYSALWHELGGERLKDWHNDRIKRGLLVVNGNAVVKNLTAEGQCNYGWTDTDDYYLALDDARTVDLIPLRTPSGKTICIPNSVAMIRGTTRPEAAKRLIEFLLSEETESRLAKSRSRQIPLGPVQRDELPEEVRWLATLAEDAVDLNLLHQAHDECRAWLETVYID
jgi:iron(III) transport system substrate-binding protein